jgi:hypothetical protein
MKKILYLITGGSMIALFALAGCGTAPPVSPVAPPPLNHPVDIRFSNCNACHFTDQMTVTPFPHFGSQGFEFTNSECTAPGCHPLQPTP